MTGTQQLSAINFPLCPPDSGLYRVGHSVGVAYAGESLLHGRIWFIGTLVLAAVTLVLTGYTIGYLMGYVAGDREGYAKARREHRERLRRAYDEIEARAAEMMEDEHAAGD